VAEKINYQTALQAFLFSTKHYCISLVKMEILLL